MEFYVRIGGRGRKKIFVPLHGSRGVKNSQIHPYVINELPLSGNRSFYEPHREIGAQFQINVTFLLYTDRNVDCRWLGEVDLREMLTELCRLVFAPFSFNKI